MGDNTPSSLVAEPTAPVEYAELISSESTVTTVTAAPPVLRGAVDKAGSLTGSSNKLALEPLRQVNINTSLELKHVAFVRGITFNRDSEQIMEEFLEEVVEVDGTSLPDDHENVPGYVATACNYVTTFASSGKASLFLFFSPIAAGTAIQGAAWWKP